jgi:hypothetical protein
MGTSLNGLTPAGTYPGLIKTGDNAPIDGTLKTLSDGNGNNLPMAVSTTAVNFTNQLQQSGVAVPTASQVAAKQDTLVSGTNIKTINGTSVLGSGNIAVVTSPSGVSGAIQFSNGSAFASDASNLFWDDTNKRLGVGTNAPSTPLSIISGNGSADGMSGISLGPSPANFRLSNYFNIGIITAPSGPIYAIASNGFQVGTSYANASGVSAGMLGVRGSGSTSATTSLLVQNSAGTQLLKVDDGGNATLFNALNLTNGNTIISQQSGNLRFEAVNSITSDIRINPFRQVNINNGNTYTAQASAILQVDSTTKGFLPPVMTTTQKNAIASPAAGLVVYDSTTNKLCCYNGSTWNDLF